MPQKRPSPLEDPPTASSSSESEDEQQPPSQEKHAAEEEVDSSEEEEGSSEEEEEEEDNGTNSPPLSQPASIPIASPSVNSHHKPAESESATESDAESDTDSDQASPSPPPNPKVKPIATKPIDQTVKPKAQVQTQPSAAPAKSSGKRAAENNSHAASDPKKPKKKAADAVVGSGSDEEADDDGKKDPKKLFQRLWTNEDEIAILKGIHEYISKTGGDPVKQPDAFYDFVKKSLQGDGNSYKLKDKVKRLKKKFETTASKGKNGEDPNFPKPHDQKIFELSKKVWGRGANEAEEKPKANGKPAKTPKKDTNTSSKGVKESTKKSKPELKQELLLLPPPESEPVKESAKESAKVNMDDTSLLSSEMFRYGNGLNEDVVKRGLELIGASKRAEFEGRWKQLQVAEMELFVERAQLMRDQSRSILEAYKSFKN